MAKKGKTSSLDGRSRGTLPPPIPIEFSAGMKVRISHDIIVNGMIAFYKGETVYIDAVDPNYSRPEYQYVVASKYMNFQKFQLSSLDLIAIEPTKPKAGLVDGAAIKGWHAVKGSTALAALAIVVGLVIIAAIVYFVGYGFKWSARPVTSADEQGQVTFIAGIDATNALATAPGQLLKYEGSKWTPAVALSFEVTDIAAVDATHAWITGMDGKVYFYDGTTVSVQLDTRTGESFDAIQAVCALDPKHVWVAGTANVVHGMREGVVYFYNGTA